MWGSTDATRGVLAVWIHQQDMSPEALSQNRIQIALLVNKVP